MVDEEIVDLVGRGVADRIGQVDRRRARLDDRFDDARQKIHVASAWRLRQRTARRRCSPRACLTAAIARSQALIARDVQFLREMQVGGRDERVDARALGALQRLARALDVFGPAAGQRGDDRPPHARGHLLHAFRIVQRGDGKARFDQVHAQRIELLWRARTFSLVRSEKPGACSPSRRVVSKIVTRSVAMLTFVRHLALNRQIYINEFVITIAYTSQRVDLAELRVFLTVAAERSFSRAAVEAAPDPARRQPGDPPARGRGRGAAVRSIVEGRHADRGGAGVARTMPSGSSACRRRRSSRFASCGTCSAAAC